jgi:hypothetical protein
VYGSVPAHTYTHITVDQTVAHKWHLAISELLARLVGKYESFLFPSDGLHIKKSVEYPAKSMSVCSPWTSEDSHMWLQYSVSVATRGIQT